MDLCKRYNKMVKEKEELIKNPEKPDPYLLLDNWEVGEGMVETHPGEMIWIWSDSSTGDATYTTDTTDGTVNIVTVRPSHSGSFSIHYVPTNYTTGEIVSWRTGTTPTHY